LLPWSCNREDLAMLPKCTLPGMLKKHMDFHPSIKRAGQSEPDLHHAKKESQVGPLQLW
jgi:hypothetical protein